MTCGKPAAPLTALEWFTCVLEEGHDGDCRPGGTCLKHGAYVVEPNVVPQCPRWPECIKGVC